MFAVLACSAVPTGCKYSLAHQPGLLLIAHPSSCLPTCAGAFAHIRLEEYGSAIADATKALECDPKYAKAYYRRGDAAFALSRFKDAVRDFRTAAKLAPKDPDLRRKVRSPSCCLLMACQPILWLVTGAPGG